MLLTVIAWDAADVFLLAVGLHGDEVGGWVKAGAQTPKREDSSRGGRVEEVVARMHRFRVRKVGGAEV
jgi:hypothetical protein